jgi:2-polyprenyl-3-methyl-5-hydroxy-6-metoxy-1,4-benzoquinol methylase
MVRPADQAGAETLEIMSAAPQYNRWQYSRVARYLGRRICEVGAGIGNMSSLILGGSPELLVLTDTDLYYQEALRRRFESATNVIVDELTLPDGSAGRRFQEYELDTVVALNVVEHIADDVEALRSIATMLRPRGRVVVLVPAMPALFGSLDRELGHQRRYTRGSLIRTISAAGFQVQSAFYFNRWVCSAGGSMPVSVQLLAFPPRSYAISKRWFRSSGWRTICHSHLDSR